MGLIVVPALWIVRRGPDMQRYGNPYTDTAIILRDGSTAIVEAWSGRRASIAEYRHLARELWAAGITHVRWERRRPDGSVHHVYRRLRVR